MHEILLGSNFAPILSMLYVVKLILYYSRNGLLCTTERKNLSHCTYMAQLDEIQFRKIEMRMKEDFVSSVYFLKYCN